MPLTVDPGKSSGMDEMDVAENLKVRYLYHRRADGTWLVTVTLLNTKDFRTKLVACAILVADPSRSLRCA